MTEAEAAARAFGGTWLRLVTARENAVHEIARPEGRAALRLHRMGYQTEAAIRSEVWWCGALHDAGLPVPRPLALPDGDTLLRLPSGRFATAVGWIDGAPLGASDVPLTGTARDQADLHRALGALLARVHAVCDRLSPPAGFTRPLRDRDGLVGEAPVWGRFWDHPALRPDEAALARQARDLMRERLVEAGPIGLIHADVLRENVLVNGHSLSLIDFDDAGFGYRSYDLGTVLVQSQAEPHLPQIAEALADGYAAHSPLDPAILPAMTLMRCCASVGWTMPRLALDDPIHRSHIVRMLRLAEHLLAGRAGWPARP
jgi:Ser/Thr protein kinase RdoA (MazF antagonist)